MGLSDSIYKTFLKKTKLQECRMDRLVVARGWGERKGMTEKIALGRVSDDGTILHPDFDNSNINPHINCTVG